MTALLRPVLALGLLAALWQAVVWAAVVPERYFPPIATVVQAGMSMIARGQMQQALFDTGSRAILGAIAVNLIGIGLGLAATGAPSLRRILDTVAAILQPVPPAAVVPMAVFALGLGWKLYAFVVVLVTIWPPYLATVSALAATNPVLLSVGRMAGFGPVAMLWHIRLPAAMPEILAGVRYATTIALIAVIVSEMITGRDGIGFLLFQKAFAIRIPEVFALMFAVGLLGSAMGLAVSAVYRGFAGWHLAQRGRAA
ncbi:taurine transport system permease protein/nitrate/nitrite transport system permease protein/putative hydroxymethylpyrimidine transport system permease protein [Rhodobacter viridis]|uniref:Taurine transport system permease protein/nitrate/nitrite transport system permease protein/putative hydroxymethylpyrimidine transport system permease protein n=1 Tax=Rhodobacter viridis TaxID=1054202 RepID=A0A318U234_9RHOB|nr:ABC transporter permease subunit [Rhodobacter viridis]PYF12642.1 taurine transport system permease protein/nitrate/nitrite transport system permease protein/putative hydroxymethylpyrimidine transport system permease protein [Rhodobacter viridis]